MIMDHYNRFPFQLLSVCVCVWELFVCTPPWSQNHHTIFMWLWEIWITDHIGVESIFLPHHPSTRTSRLGCDCIPQCRSLSVLVCSIWCRASHRYTSPTLFSRYGKEGWSETDARVVQARAGEECPSPLWIWTHDIVSDIYTQKLLVLDSLEHPAMNRSKWQQHPLNGPLHVFSMLCLNYVIPGSRSSPFCPKRLSDMGF